MVTKTWIIAGGVVLVAFAGISEVLRRDKLLNKKFILLKQKDNEEKGKLGEKEGNQIRIFNKQDNQQKRRRIDGIHLDGLRSDGNGTRRDADKPHGKPGENRFGAIEKPNREIAKLRDTIEAMKKEYWKEQEDYFLKEAEFRLYKNLFLDEAGLFFYIQRLIGFIHYDFFDKNDMTYLKLKLGDQLIDGIYSVLTIKMKRLEEPLAFVLPDDLRVPITEAAFYNNLGMNTAESDYDKLLLMKQTIENKRAYLKETRDLMQQDENNLFFKKLWEDTKEILLEIIKYKLEESLENTSTMQEIYNDLNAYVDRLIKILEDHDIHVIFYENLNEEEIKNFYSVLKSTDNAPAMMRGDNNLLCKGKMTRAKSSKADKK